MNSGVWPNAVNVSWYVSTGVVLFLSMSTLMERWFCFEKLVDEFLSISR